MERPAADMKFFFTFVDGLQFFKTGNGGKFKLMTVRSEGQFNTVVYDLQDRYRGIGSRDVVLMNLEDILSGGFQEGLDPKRLPPRFHAKSNFPW